jgi:hypothetical protein
VADVGDDVIDTIPLSDSLTRRLDQLFAQPATTQAVSAPPASGAAPQTLPPASGSGSVLYQADWSQGMNGWVGSKNWKAVGGMLVNDGSVDNSVIASPYNSQVADYAVEAEIQGVGTASGSGSFGVFERGEASDKYYAADVWPAGGRTFIVSYPGDAILVDRPFSAGNDWHTYRLEARGNQLKVLIDGAEALQATDNKYLDGRVNGLWEYSSIQFNVRSFRVVGLGN